jgi:hypothetical protein
MNTDYPSTRQWTIRMVPWFAILISAFFYVALFGVLIFNAEARCGASLLLIIFLLAGFFAFERVNCTLDLDRRLVTLERVQLWRKTKREFPFDEVHTVSVQTSSDSESATYNVVFVLNSGDVVPLTKYTSSGKGSKEKLARAIIAYMNQARSSAVKSSMDGEIRIEQAGETNGIPWQVAFVAGNDSLPQTRWHTTRSQLTSGFVILMPALGAKTGAMPSGIFGAAVRMIYGQYLRMLDVSESDLPGFDQAQILPGDQVGLDKRFTILTNDPATATSWLTGERIRHLTTWTQSNPLKASNAATDPHLVITKQGLRMTFRGRYNQPDQIAAIARLGTDLAE